MKILDQLLAGSKLIATPPTTIGGRWTFTLDKQPVLLTAGQVLEIQRSSQLSVARLAGDRLLYRAMTKSERKAIRAQWLEWQKSRGVKECKP